MGLNLPDISQIGRNVATAVLDNAPAAIARTIEDIKQEQQARRARRVLRQRAQIAFSLTEGNGAFLKSIRILKRKKGEPRYIHQLVPERLDMSERKELSTFLKTAFPNMNRRARRQAAFGRSWLLLAS